VEKFWAPEALALFLAFFLPGFVTTTVWRLLIPEERIDFGKDLPRIIGYSALHYSATLWLVLMTPAGLPRLIAAYVVVLVLPSLWPPLLVIIRDPERWLSRFTSGQMSDFLIKPQARPWDIVVDSLQAEGGCWIRIRLKTGRWIGGTLGARGRYATYPDGDQLYLAEEIEFDDSGKMLGLMPKTRGVLVEASAVEFMEFFK
jgi:hypothetical protein